MNPFDYVNSINTHKRNLMVGSENDELAEKEYVPFLTNKALSYHTETLLYSNEMNRYAFLPNKLQYEYLLHSVRPGKRFSKWAKKDNVEQIQAVAQYYQCNMQRAQEYISILSIEDIEEIQEEIRNL